MQHSAQYVAELKEAEASPGGWRQFEGTGRACVVCPCGTVTGFVPREEAVKAYKEHGLGRPLAEPTLMSPGDATPGTAHQAAPTQTVQLGLDPAKAEALEREFRALIEKFTRS